MPPGDEAVKRATGATWREWIALLDREGAKDMAHKDVAAMLEARHGLSGWWAQSVTVEYERARGKRVLGQTSGATFQLGVQRTFPGPPDEAWARLVRPAGVRAWLGGSGRARLEEGAAYRFADGTRGEVRVARIGDVLRLTWQPPEWEKPSTIQVRVLPRAGGKCAISFHHEGLPDAAAREAMKARWEGALEALGCAAAPARTRKSEKPTRGGGRRA